MSSKYLFLSSTTLYFCVDKSKDKCQHKTKQSKVQKKREFAGVRL